MAYPKTLADFTGPCRESGTQLVYQFCPVCNSTRWKLYVDPVTGRWFCFAGEHGGGGCVQPGGLTHDTNNRVALEFDRHTRHVWPAVDLPDTRALTSYAVRYLRDRGLDTTYTAMLGMAEMVEEPRILVPYRGVNGEIISWIARDYTNTLSPKYTQAPGSKPLYMLPRLIRAPEVVVVEGVFDAITVWRALLQRTPVIALGGTSLSAINELELRGLVGRYVFLMLDRDTGGIKGTAKLVNQLRDRYQVVDLAPLVLEEGEDPGSAKEESLARMWEYVVWPNKN